MARKEDWGMLMCFQRQHSNHDIGTDISSPWAPNSARERPTFTLWCRAYLSVCLNFVRVSLDDETETHHILDTDHLVLSQLRLSEKQYISAGVLSVFRVSKIHQTTSRQAAGKRNHHRSTLQSHVTGSIRLFSSQLILEGERRGKNEGRKVGHADWCNSSMASIGRPFSTCDCP